MELKFYVIFFAYCVGSKCHGQCFNETSRNVTRYFYCPKDYYENKAARICYKAIFNKSSQIDAGQHCSSAGASLVTIPDSAVNVFLYELIWLRYRDVRDSAPVPFWIGLNDREDEGTYTWSRCEDGEIMKGSYANWLREDMGPGGSPADPTHSRNCVTWNWSTRPGWKSENCSNEYSFICQIHLADLSTASPNTTDKMLVESLPPLLTSAHIALISVGACLILVIFVACITYWTVKKKAEKNRVHTLRRTGIFPTAVDGRPSVMTNAFGTPASRFAFGA